MNTNRLVLGLFGMALATAFFSNAQGYPEAAAQMPLIYSVTVGLFSLAMVCSELLRWRAARQREVEPAVASEAPAGPPRYAVTAFVFVLAIAYVAAITTLGYVLATVLFHPFWEFSGDEQKPHVQSFIMNSGLTGAFLLIIAYGL